MGYAMAERLAKAGCDISVWNRTRAKAEPLAKSGAKVVGALTDLAACDIVFTMVSTGKDVKEVLFGANGVLSRKDAKPEDRRGQHLDLAGGIGGDPREARRKKA